MLRHANTINKYNCDYLICTIINKQQLITNKQQQQQQQQRRQRRLETTTIKMKRTCEDKDGNSLKQVRTTRKNIVDIRKFFDGSYKCSVCSKHSYKIVTCYLCESIICKDCAKTCCRCDKILCDKFICGNILYANDILKVTLICSVCDYRTDRTKSY